jgi:acyl carrier protein
MQDARGSAGVDDKHIIESVCALLESRNTRHISLSRETRITSELNVDSVEIMDLIMELEQTFDIDIPINTLSDVETIGDLADVVSAHVRGR